MNITSFNNFLVRTTSFSLGCIGSASSGTVSCLPSCGSSICSNRNLGSQCIPWSRLTPFSLSSVSQLCEGQGLYPSRHTLQVQMSLWWWWLSSVVVLLLLEGSPLGTRCRSIPNDRHQTHELHSRQQESSTRGLCRHRWWCTRCVPLP